MFQTARAVILLTTAILLVGCGADAPEADAPESDDTTKPVATYTVHGRVLEMPAVPGGEIRLEHEAIDSFVDFRGNVVGMDAMTMSFPLVEGAAGDIAPGDIVEFDLQIDWDAEPLSRVTRLERLPEDTELVFGRAEPPQD